MAMVLGSHSTDSERAELEVVLEALARTPRLARLLRYLGDRSLQRRNDEITEYNIATEVFGRSKTSFDGTTDSIARVETHRLRKRLKEYYETEGKDHAVLISLPHRSYVPEFSLRAVSVPAPQPSVALVNTEEPADVSSALALAPETPQSTPQIGTAQTSRPARFGLRSRTLTYSVAALAILLLATLGAIRFFKRNAAANSPATDGATAPNPGQTPTPPGAAHVPLRLLAGYAGTPRIDSAGDYWQADRYVTGGAAFRRPDIPVARTSDQMLFEYWRTGDFDYNIPLAPGPYELHLFFVAPPQEDFKTSSFHVAVNGPPILKAFNIGADALGVNIADERVFKDIYPDGDGVLHLKFVQERSTPSLTALEILPGLPHRQLPIRIVMQHAAVTDHSGNVWHPDNYFQNGTISDLPREISGTPDPSLYAQERYGHFTYAIPVDTRSRYTLVLHFAEMYWGPNASGQGGVGSRIFRVYCNGITLLDNFDIFKEAGSLHAVTKTFYHLHPSPEGKLDLTFDPIVNYATISAIEVIDETE